MGEQVLQTSARTKFQWKFGIFLFGTLLLSSSTALFLLLKSHTEVQAKVEKPEPLPEIVSVPKPKIQDYQVFMATAYCNQGITRSGVRVNRGIVAADPARLPLGSVIQVQAGKYSGIYTVLDTGSAIKGQMIDIYMPDYYEAIQFGRQRVKIRVLRHGWETSPPDSTSKEILG